MTPDRRKDGGDELCRLNDKTNLTYINKIFDELTVSVLRT